jgi:hypothetical protein
MKMNDLELSNHSNNFANNILMMCSRNVTIEQNEQIVSIAVFTRKWMLFGKGLTCNACGDIAFNSVYIASNVYEKVNMCENWQIIFTKLPDFEQEMMKNGL